MIAGKRFVLSVVISAALSGCATTAPQTKALLQAPPPIEKTQTIETVPFIDQDVGQCGPASLAMALGAIGHSVSVEDLAPKVMTPSKGGSLQENMVSAARREGVMAVELTGLTSLLTELDQKHPVIIFENLGLSWWQQWHYAVAIGYDLPKEDIILHSGHDANLRTDLKIFERSWKLSDYWGLVVLPPGQIARSAGELANSRAAAGLEQSGHLKEAKASYLAILSQWPQSLSALIGMGNVTYAEKDFESAIRYLKQALLFHPDSTAAQHNLKVAESKVQSK